MFDSVPSAIGINTRNSKDNKNHGKKSIDKNNNTPYPSASASASASTSSFSSPGSQWYYNQSCDHLPPPMSSTSTVPESPAVGRSRSSTRSPIRLSVFGARSRSNTATSSSSSYKSPASSLTSGDSASRRSSQDGRTLSSATSLVSEKEASTAKSFLSRGSRILRRKGSKFSISSTLTLDEEDEMARGSHSASQRMDGVGIFHRSHRSRHSGTRTYSLKQNISDPFDFQHVTHTSPSQLPPMDSCQLDDIVTEFSVIRASQRPGHELKGIRAESLHFQNFSSDNISIKNDASPCTSDSRSQHAHSRPTSSDVRTSPTSPSRLQSHLNSRSVENFSRPVSRLSRQQSPPSMIAPPRSSSKLATPDIPEPSPQTIDALLGLHSTFAVPETLYDDTQEQHLPKLDLPSVFPDVGHTLIPDDDMPVMTRSPSNILAFDLADVPEEDETAMSRNNDARNSTIATSSEPFRFGQSTPRVDFDKPLPAVPSPKQLIPEPLGSPTIPTLHGDSNEAFAQKRWKSNKRRSIFQRPLDDLSWEDDIDYCYEHAAESNSNFDWRRTSFEEVEMKSKLERLTIHASSAADPDTPIAIQNQGSREGSEHSDQNTINASSFSAPSFTTPNYDVTPMTSTSPLPCVQIDTLSQADYFRDEHVPILSSPFGDDIVSSQAYHGLIPIDQKVDENYPLYAHVQVDEPFDSPRGSCSEISKCNSEESIILSRAASVARKHRSSLSTTSVPELVHSSNCSHSALDRDSVCSAGEQHPQQQTKETLPAPTLSPVPRPRPITTHQRSKSLARELTQRSNPSISPNSIDSYTSGISSAPTMPYHDRAKSVSALDLRQPTSPVKSKAPEPRKRSATITRGSSGRRARKSYSLFPTAAAAAPAPVAPASR
ncbi:hypothetical protein BDBG_08539 [Blastomyces gilchristii SLH14081]|uniref:CRIB domain-containing protein n=1 Tax=Blastomyces gilchristii (strain SLH14081) TaxID=559298 RepID=A0A179UYZ1_BLAGS|nr:uncharacterized protein BDBG_08539 [Blastomyces gilchristii SLH14081]OAT13315.1 hypothetical protein BDBG_08539 [Blastomyces gilchristii SLH14081]